MTGSEVVVKTKHRFLSGPADPGGTRMILIVGTIVLEDGSDDFSMDLSNDFHTLEGIIIQGDGGYTIQYDYSGKNIVLIGLDGTATAKDPLTAVTGKDAGDLTLRYFAWGV